MAKVNGPLFSLGASGQIGEALVYAQWKGRPYVREYVTPTNPRTLIQRLTRAGLAFLAARWASLSTTDKTYWTAQAASRQISGFNAYTSDNLTRWNDGLGMPDNPTDAPTAAPGAPSITLDATQTGRFSGTLTTPGGGVAPIAAFITARTSSLNDVATESVLHLAVAINDDFTFVVPDLPAGTYNVNAFTMNATGVFSAFADPEVVTVN